MKNRIQEDEFDAVLSRAFIQAFQMELQRYEAACKEYEHLRPTKKQLEEVLRAYEAAKRRKSGGD